MIFVHNDRLRTVNDDIQTVKIDICIVVCILIDNIILYGDHFSRKPLYTYISFNGGPALAREFFRKLIYVLERREASAKIMVHSNFCLERLLLRQF